MEEWTPDDNETVETVSVGALAMASLVVGSLVLCMQLVVMLLFAERTRTPNDEESFQSLLADGDFLALAGIAGALVAIPALLAIARRQTKGGEWEFTGLVASSGRAIAFASGCGVAFVFVGDAMFRLLGVDTLSEDIIAAYRSAWPPILWLAIGVAAPLVEELFFRGYLYSGLRATRIGFWGTAVVTSVIWAGLHIQYPFIVIVAIAGMGIVLAVIRERSESVLPCIAMHIVVNVVSLVQTHLFVHATTGG